MSGQFTPEPWAVCQSAPNQYWRAGRTIYSVAQGSQIAYVAMFRPDDEAFAIARLIAAAPDLLAALQNIVKSVALNQCAMNRGLEDSALAAIRKAIGETA